MKKKRVAERAEVERKTLVRKRIRFVMEINGQMVGDEGIMERIEYISGLLMRGVQEEEGTKRDVELDLKYEGESISIKKGVEGTGKLKSGKAPGIHGIDAD